MKCQPFHPGGFDYVPPATGRVKPGRKGYGEMVSAGVRPARERLLVIELFNSFRDALYHVLLFFQELVEPLMGSQSYWFSIVMLTVAVRSCSSRSPSSRSGRPGHAGAGPEIKKLQAKHKNDKTKLNEEMMALYKERGFNPMAGCWPLLAQMPFFFALYQVIYAQQIAGGPNVLIGKTFFGVPLQQHWLQLQGWDKIFSAAGSRSSC